MTLICISRAALLALLLAPACAPVSSAPSSRAPTNDVTPPATTAGDGEVLGADRVPPAQKLEQGVQLDNEGDVKPAARPAGD